MPPMFRFALAVLFITSTQVVVSLAGLKFNFTDVRQCEPFAFSFTGENAEGSPLATSLSIIPIGAVPVVVPIPNPQAISTGVFSTSLPFPAGTRFIASLEDGRGSPVIKVSDVMTVLPSQNQNNDSCLSDQGPAPVQHFTLQDRTVSQCQEFTLSYNTTEVSQAPRVRVYNPRGFSFLLNLTSEDVSAGTATYLMNVERGKEVVLLIDSGNGLRETTSLLTVTGDSTDPEDCLAKQRDVEATMEAATKTPGISSKAVIIGSAAGGGAIVLIAVIMCIFMVRERARRRKENMNRPTSFVGARMYRGKDEKPKMPPPTIMFSAPSAPSPEPANRSLTDNRYLSSQKGANRPDSLASWIQVTPEDQRRNPRYQSLAPSLALSESRNVVPQSVDDRERLSLNSLDIEGMLNMATLQSEAARKNSTTAFGPDLTSASPPKPRIITDTTVPRRELKVNSDIPDDLLSAYSRDSVNPFSTLNDPSSPEQRRGPSRDLLAPSSALGSPASPFSRPVAGLPVSPRDVHRVPGRSPISRSSSSLNYYEVGIAR